MRFLSMVKLTEGKSSPPSKAMIDAVNQLVQEVAKEGCVMVQSGGLYPTSAGARVRLAGSKITVTGRPVHRGQGDRRRLCDLRRAVEGSHDQGDRALHGLAQDAHAWLGR